MTAPDSVQFKVTLNRDGKALEIRKFTIDKQVVTNYSYLRQKLYMMFPALQSSGMMILWKDSANDMITIGSDEELMIALYEMESSACKQLTINLPTPTVVQGGFGARPNSIPPTSHGNVVCDGCDYSIIGYRYKCLNCFDYDLCFDCEHKGLHSDHVMIRYPFPIGRDPHFIRKMKKLHKRFDSRYANVDMPNHPHKMFKCSSKPGKCPAMSDDIIELVNDFIGTLTAQVDVTPAVINQIIESLSDVNLSGGNEEGQNASSSTGNEHSGRKSGNAKDGERKGDQEHGRRKRCASFAERGYHSQPGPGIPVHSILSNVMQQVGETAPRIVPNILNVLNQISAAGEAYAASNPTAQKDATPGASGAPNEAGTSTQTTPPPAEPMVITVEDGPELSTTMTDKTSSTAANPPLASAPSAPSNSNVVDFNQLIDEQLRTMLCMGFNNDGGWLRDILVAKNGDIAKVLDQLSASGKDTRLERLELD